MNNYRPSVLSIAGFDPSAGAGVLADIKTFENCGVYGLGVVSSLTVQNDIEFEKVQWLPLSQIIEQIQVLQKRFAFEFIKIGLIENLEILNQLISYLKSHISNLKIMWDPILKASAGFDFHNNVNQELLENICKNLYLITPNITEAFELGHFKQAHKNAVLLSTFCNVYLKGGHDEENLGRDILYTTQGKEIMFESVKNNLSPKHGSGCVLSSAITAYLAKGYNLQTACKKGKKYITNFLGSNDSLLGYHIKQTTIEQE